MPELNIAVAVIVSVVFAPVYAIGVCFLFGVGGILLGGYHKDPRSERGKRADRYIVRRAGILTLIVLSSLHACILTGVLGEMTACYRRNDGLLCVDRRDRGDDRDRFDVVQPRQKDKTKIFRA